MKSSLIAAGIAAMALTAGVLAQGRRDASPAGTAATEVLGKYDTSAVPQPVYKGGKWIEIEYSRPMLRGRADVFGKGADYGKKVNAGAPVWRAGANQTTRLKTEVPLEIGGKRLAPGEYDLSVRTITHTLHAERLTITAAKQFHRRDWKFSVI